MKAASRYYLYTTVMMIGSILPMEQSYRFINDTDQSLSIESLYSGIVAGKSVIDPHQTKRYAYDAGQDLRFRIQGAPESPIMLEFTPGIPGLFSSIKKGKNFEIIKQ